MVETELQIINISIIFPLLDYTCINHDLQSNHRNIATTLPTLLYVCISVLVLGSGDLQPLTHLLSGKMTGFNFLS